MGVYNGAKFAKYFSERTMGNLKYIKDIARGESIATTALKELKEGIDICNRNILIYRIKSF